MDIRQQKGNRTVKVFKIDLAFLANERKRSDLLLSVSSGALLGLSFPPSPFYSLAYVAFIPFFVLIERVKSYRELFSYSYIFLLVFNVITLYWTGGWTHGRDAWLMTSNAALVLVHPLFHIPSIFLSFYVWKRLGRIGGLTAFIFLWVSYEYSHSLTEFSFPWITIGNSQAYDLYRGQIAEYTSTYGLSFLLLLFNGTGFNLLKKLSIGEWQLKSRPALLNGGFLVLLYLAPLLYGWVRMSTHQDPDSRRLIKVGVIQPNFDPWEKWGEGFASKWDSYQRQLNLYIQESKKLSAAQSDLIIWPETAIPFPILIPRFAFALTPVLQAVDSMRAPVFTGLHHVEYSDSSRASVTAQSVGGGLFAESYNSAALFETGGKVSRVYKKIVLVPFAERIPYAHALRFLIDPLKWNVGISSWGKGHDTLLFKITTGKGDSITFSGMICYESVYPNFVREFVKKGAEFLIVITNDSWWGNTSGTYQHAAYASFRAIENRRWVVQCANGGISEFVDPLGNVYSATKMFTEAEVVRHIEPRSELTFYAKNGDIFAQLCLFCSAAIVILAAFRKKASENRE